MYILNIASAMKKMSVKEIRDFIFENYYKRIVFSKEKKDQQLFAIKLIEKLHDPCNTKEHYQSFRRNKNTKSVKQ